MLSVHMLIMRYSVGLFQTRLADGQLTTLLCAVTLVVKIIATDEKPMKVCITARGEGFAAEVEDEQTPAGGAMREIYARFEKELR